MFKIANAQDFKRTLATVAIAAVVASGAATAARAQGANGVTWSFDEQTGTLTISGNGATGDFGPKDSAEAAPWSADGYKIKSLVIEDGVTEIGDNAFAGLDNLASAVIPETITSIGDAAFSGCHSLDSFGYGNNKSNAALIKGNVTHLGQDAFYGCERMNDIYLEATDLHDYHFDTLDSSVGWKYDFNNYQATTIHIAKGFGDHITLDQCESLYQWQRVAGDKAPIVADLDVEGTVKGDRGQQAEAAKGAASQKAADEAAANGLMATSKQNRDAQAELAAKGATAAPGSKAAADEAAANGLKATSTQNAEAQAELAAKGAAATADTSGYSQKAADEAAANGLKATSAENAKAQEELAARRNAAIPGSKAAASKKAAKQAKEVGKKAKDNEIPKKRDNDRPGI